jgi:hypothetical protein
MTMPEPLDHAENRGVLETILRYIPGFRGYLEKEYRRQSDQLQRQWLADRLQRSKRTLDQVARRLADAGRIDELPPIDQARGRLDKLAGRIRGAVQGYSGFFDLVRVDEQLLDRVYTHDAAFMAHVDGLANAIEALTGQQDRLPQAVAALIDQIDAAGRQWDDREDILKGVE